jgi:hypothetical protein
LAYQAGFSLQQSEFIAEGAQSADEGHFLPAPWVVIGYACLTRDAEASREVQRNHFPSYGHIPSLPAQRVVVPGKEDNAANSWARELIKTSFKDMPEDYALRQFGQSLHPLEDSWSHQGEPDVPPGWACDQTLAWGHPVARGGVWHHDADLTFLHPDDLLATAEKVFSLLTAYRKAHPMKRMGPGHAPADWPDIKPLVEKFAEARTKAKKQEWVNANAKGILDQKPFLKTISLPNGPGYVSSWRPSVVRLFATSFQETSNQREVPYAHQKEFNEAASVVDSFLFDWVIRQSSSAAMERADLAAIGVSKETFEGWLKMWLVEDHGEINELGHGAQRSNSEKDTQSHPTEQLSPS